MPAPKRSNSLSSKETMPKEITTILENQDWYKSLIEDCQSILGEGIWNYRLTLIKTYHLLGKRILEDYKEFKKAGIKTEKEIRSHVTKDLKQSDRTIRRSIQFARKYPDLDKLPEGKNISWHKICNLYLPEPKEENNIPLPKGKYNIIYADPPWKYWAGGEKNATRHYKCMEVEEIKALKVQELVAENCILFLWATWPAIKEALQVIEAWGFQYSTCGFVWIKSKKDNTGFGFGCGNWTRANTEFCLIATKGIIERKDATISQIIYEPTREHSQKPDIVRNKIIQLVGNLPRIELFARGKPPKGWVFWGQEVEL